MKLSKEILKFVHGKNVMLCLVAGVLFMLLANEQILRTMDQFLGPILKPVDRVLFNNNTGQLSRNFLIIIHGFVFTGLLLLINLLIIDSYAKGKKR